MQITHILDFSIRGESLVTTCKLAWKCIAIYGTILLVKVPILVLHWSTIPAQHCDTEVELHLFPPIQHTDMSHS